MAMRTIRLSWKTKDGIVENCGDGCNDGQSDQKLDHTLEPDGRYLVSPISGNKAPESRGRSCVFLKPRKFRGGVVKAKVRFEDDYSIGHVELNDLVPYDEDAPVKSSDKRPLKDEATPSGSLSEIIRRLKAMASDEDPDLTIDKFRALVAVWYAKDVIQRGANTDLYAELNRKLREILGPGNNIQACNTFMTGKRGKEVMDVLKSEGVDFAFPSLRGICS